MSAVAAKRTARSIEDQVSDEYIGRSREYELTVVEGTRVGRVNGLAVMGSDSGSVLPIMAEVTMAQGANGTVIATGMLKEIAQESIKNVSAILKKFTGKDIKNMDVHIQFIGTYGGVEGDSASISVATAVISAIEGIPVRQDVAMTGSLSVRGDVLPVGGVTYKIEAAAKAGITHVLIPSANIDDVLIEESDGLGLGLGSAVGAHVDPQNFVHGYLLWFNGVSAVDRLRLRNRQDQEQGFSLDFLGV